MVTVCAQRSTLTIYDVQVLSGVCCMCVWSQQGVLVYAKTCRARSSLGGVSVDTTSMRDNISHVVDETAMAEVCLLYTSDAADE